MDQLKSLADSLTGVRWNASQDAFLFPCPNHPGTMALAALGFGGPELMCSQGCQTADLMPKPPEKPPQSNGNGHSKPALPMDEESIHLRTLAKLEWKQKAIQTVMDVTNPQAIVKFLTPPEGMTAQEAEHFIAHVAVPTVLENKTALREPGDESEPSDLMNWEVSDLAYEANQIYLKRTPIIDRLCYTESTSLLVGPKHGGKTTNVRTVAMSVARGEPIWDRPTQKGPVLYVASGDEVASTRMELLRMGWNRMDDLVLSHMRPEAVNAQPGAVLGALADEAKRRGVVLIILDMLFDFAQIKDEMSYAGTRLAVAALQQLASETKAHVMATHHSPKYMLDTATAATAALGSQGIAARFSPIILCRKWTDELFTVESTMTRDPRGAALPQSCVAVDANGWAQCQGEFKSWMKYKLYCKRIMDHVENGEPGTNFTVGGVAKDLEIPRPEVQNALYQLFKDGALDRMKSGRSFKYFLKYGQPDQRMPD